MAEFKRIYKCNICGNVVEVLNAGVGDLVCCGENMELLTEEIKDEGQEKHVPVVEGNKVKVGEIEHPMEDKHYIQWIECDGCRKFLKPKDKPEVDFGRECKDVRIYCNIHGVWRK